MDNQVYYRLYLYAGTITVICMQWFDEYGYKEENFIKDETGFNLMFDSEIEAIDWLNENVKPEYIDPEYISGKNAWKKMLK